MDEQFEKQADLVEEIRSGDYRRSLVALRDYVAHELQGHRCTKCEMSLLRTGDTAALVLRLQKVIEDIAALPPENPAELPEGVTSLAALRSIRPTNGKPEAANQPGAQLGTKSAPRRQGGRKSRQRGSTAS